MNELADPNGDLFIYLVGTFSHDMAWRGYFICCKDRPSLCFTAEIQALCYDLSYENISWVMLKKGPQLVFYGELKTTFLLTVSENFSETGLFAKQCHWAV